MHERLKAIFAAHRVVCGDRDLSLELIGCGHAERESPKYERGGIAMARAVSRGKLADARTIRRGAAGLAERGRD
jgi:hypothetical protein